jgi:IclR family transcriptional regulator, KDG regulon repressor
MEKYDMKSLAKAFAILKLFLNNDKLELSIDEISKLSGINKPTSFRIATNLVKHGYLAQRERRGNYTLGLIYLAYYKAINSRLYFRNTVIPYLIKLSEKTNEQVSIAYADGEEDVFPEAFTPSTPQKHLLTIAPKHGSKLPLHSTSLGKIILANLTEKNIQKYFSNKELKQLTPNTITDINTIKNQLKTIKQEGVAFDDEEYDLGIRSVACGIKDKQGEIVASIAIFSPSVRMSYTRMHELSPVLLECAADISKALGYKAC